MNELFTKNYDFDGIAKRNITYIDPSFNPFSDLVSDVSSRKAADNAILKTKKRINTSANLSDFYYTTAIAYPFVHEPFMNSRYSNGCYPVWYGSLDLTTTIAETAHHTLEDLYAIDDITDFTPIIKKRAVYDVTCQALLIELSDQTDHYPDLLSNDYIFCQSIGKRIQNEGFSGCITKSARADGKNINIFKQRVLSHPTLKQQLSYEINLKDAELRVYDDQKNLMQKYQT